MRSMARSDEAAPSTLLARWLASAPPEEVSAEQEPPKPSGSAAEVLEGIRDGRSVSDLMAWGVTILARDDVMDGIPEMLEEVQVEGTFPDGTKLVTIHRPIR